MGQFSLFLLKSAIWISAFTIVYLLLLKNERFHLLKRIYLLTGMVVSLTFPLINFHSPILVTNTSTFVVGSLTDSAIQTELIQKISFIEILDAVFICGAVFMLIRLIVNSLIYVIRIARSVPVIERGARIVYNDKIESSYSFFKFIFMKPLPGSIEKEVIINHELEHIRQRHWIDILLSEIMAIFQWANPFMWLYSVYIRQNHEYLADKEAIKQSDPGIYKAVLINHLFKSNVFALSNSFSYSLNKRRFDMMNPCEVPTVRKLKILIIIPLIGLLTLAFSEPPFSHESSTPAETPYSNVTAEETALITVEVMPSYPGGNQNLENYVSEKIKYPKKAKKLGIEGKVVLRFVIDTKGNVVNPQILKGVNPLIDAEAIRVVKSLKGFSPGKQNGIPVNVYYVLPINFSLKE